MLVNRERVRGSMGISGRAILLAAMALVTGAAPMRAVEPWIAPTPEELAMTSVPGYPGIPAVILFREEITSDELHSVQHYERIKILTEKGKDEANVELRFASVASIDHDDYNDYTQITDIAGRTIHPDGTIIPFTGKPYLKMLDKKSTVKGDVLKVQSRVFTLPDVEVGSIIEYRYATRIEDNIFQAPEWYIQGELYTKSAHFAWYPTTHELRSLDGMINTITWLPILPPGVTLVNEEHAGLSGKREIGYEVTVHDLAPQPDEEYMPPIKSLAYRVLFAYSPFRTPAEFWKGEGKKWSKHEDSFIGPDSSLKEATQTVIAGAQTPDEKLHKIYTAVMALENTDFTRDHSSKENKAAGLKVASAGDVFKSGRGSGEQLTGVFVGMARAAGLKAYIAMVPDRSRRLLMEGLLSFQQFDNSFAIVNVDGKDQFFDPGQRYCPYGHLAWEDTYTQGVRQTEGGTDFVDTPGDNYADAKTQRIADLKMDEHGGVTGSISITYTGATALGWRQRALTGDEESLNHALRTHLEEMLPKTLEVKVGAIENLTDYEKPLIVHFDIKGGFGTPTGKRMILPVDVFLSEDAVTFPHEKRELPVYFQYPQTVRDATRIIFPPSMSIEATPAAAQSKFQKLGQYGISVTSAPTSFTTQRSYIFNTFIVPVKDYGELRTFYTEMETKDKDSVVLKMNAESASAAAPGGN